MIRFLSAFLLLFIGLNNVYAHHIAGGDLMYTYEGIGAAPNTSRYKIILKLFRECNSTGQDLEGEVAKIGVYDNANNSKILNLILSKDWFGQIPTIQNTPGAIPCLVNAPNVCYQVGTFVGFIEVPDNQDGYTISWIRYTRANTLNVTGGFIGATFISTIPGKNALPLGFNNSAVFSIRDTAIICKDKAFSVDFSAQDPDGDSLSYSFTEAFDGTGGDNSNPNPDPPQFLSLPSLNYVTPFSGTQPLGPSVTIDPKTGIISGIAPSAQGKYVVCVKVREWRNGKPISEQRKDFNLSVGSCDFSAADLNLENVNCKQFNVTFENANNAGITSYLWNFGDPASGAANTSQLPKPSHTFTDTGTYKVTLTVTAGNNCVSKDSGYWHIFPGFTPKIEVKGSCYESPFTFLDKTEAKYGKVNSWFWDFGNQQSNTDTAHTQNATYQYPAPQNYNVTLIVGSSKGCMDTLVKNIMVNDKPLLSLGFKDTLICSIDTLAINAQTNPGAVITWSPATNISSTTQPNILVWPKDTTNYIINIVEGSCKRTDTVRVNVLDFITVRMPHADTVVCATDSFVLYPQSHALQYLWTPSTGLSNPTIKNPKVSLQQNIKYYVTANLGKCQDNDSINIKVVAYPQSNIQPVDTLCFGDSVTLHANIVGSSFIWSPTESLSKFNTLNPTAKPFVSTTYYLFVYDTLGCPNPYLDSVQVRVRDKVQAYAGNDTTVVAFQPLQLLATGGSQYLWMPPAYLNKNDIANPVATIPKSAPDEIKYRVKVTTDEGCSDYDEIIVKVFKTGPDIFIPTGFSPNNDGLNDALKAIPVGIKQFNYLKIYNRWGAEIFSTTDYKKGWDGTINGVKQPSGTYVFVASGMDYFGNHIFKKGTVVLIR